MSRRRTRRHGGSGSKQARWVPDQLEAPQRTTDDGHAIPAWWPEPGTPEEDEYAARTYGVVRWVYRKYAVKTYPAIRGDDRRELRADLMSWLLVRALEFRATFEPNPDRFEPDAEDPVLVQWLQVLRVSMSRSVKWHWSNTQVPAGLHPLEARQPVWQSKSTEEPARTHAGSSTRATMHEGDVRTLGDVGHALWSSGEPVQPEVHYLATESMWEAVERLTGERRSGDYEAAVRALDDLVPDPRPDQCEVFGCDGKVKSRHLCGAHYSQWRTANMPPCQVEGCDRPQQSKGLCAACYKRNQQGPPCQVEGCDNPGISTGLCGKHYQSARTDRLRERLGIERAEASA